MRTQEGQRLPATGTDCWCIRPNSDWSCHSPRRKTPSFSSPRVTQFLLAQAVKVTRIANLSAFDDHAELFVNEFKRAVGDTILRRRVSYSLPQQTAAAVVQQVSSVAVKQVPSAATLDLACRTRKRRHPDNQPRGSRRTAMTV